MPRATWSGSISFGLVSVPVKLITAVRSHDIHFTQLHKDTKARVRRKRVDAETGEEVPYEDIVKGYEVGDGEYVVVDPDELDELDPKASRIIDIHDFVDLDEIDPLYYDRPYYLAPDGEAALKAYRLLAEAMERTSKVAIAKFVMRGKEYLAAIRSKNGLLLLSTMNFADEVMDPAELDVDLEAVEVRDREVEMAEQLISSLTAEFDADRYHDEYRDRVMELIEAKAKGQKVTVPEQPEGVGEVVDLMQALEQSLQRAGSGGGDGAASGDGSRSSGGDGYSEMTREELYDLAQDRDVPGRSKMSKDELVAALRETDERAGAA